MAGVTVPPARPAHMSMRACALRRTQVHALCWRSEHTAALEPPMSHTPSPPASGRVHSACCAEKQSLERIAAVLDVPLATAKQMAFKKRGVLAMDVADLEVGKPWHGLCSRSGVSGCSGYCSCCKQSTHQAGCTPRGLSCTGGGTEAAGPCAQLQAPGHSAGA